MTEALLIAAIMLSLINTVILILLFNERRSASRELDRLRRDIAEEGRNKRIHTKEHRHGRRYAFERVPKGYREPGAALQNLCA